MVAPMLLASLGLHGLFLLVPMGQSKEGAIPPPDPEKDSVAISRSLPPAPPNPPGLSAANPALVGAPLPAAGGLVTTPAKVKVGSLPAPAASKPRPVTRASATPAPRPSAPAASVSPSSSLPLTPPSAPVTPARPAIDPNLGQRLLAYASTLQLSGERVNQLRGYISQRFSHNDATTTFDAYANKLKQWETQAQQETGIPDLTAETDRSQLSITYQQRVCLRVQPGEARVGALVNPDGSQRQEPVLLRSSGYAILDQEAVALVKNHRFSPNDTIKAYTVPVKNRLDYGQQPCLGR